ncbi:site-specific recombinase XerD [Desulfocurvibacter africanus PCS]|uniref:Site-specific recombinase XerD n=1 Tax=Desulfocurvibacter africanus PCS TaxID=1262666 RepID=M5Q1I4_DESAF|nr:site-specific integrase [Desulfocurvibacter africanus]EMG36578.1 site-specific recombinase XerD [Desulfocurvibacter africanus PCS]
MPVKVQITPDGRYYIAYRIPGRKSPTKEYFGRGKDALRDARIRAAEISLSKEKGEIARGSSAMFLDELAQGYLNDAKARGASESYIKDFASLLNKKILPVLTTRPVDQLEHADIIRLASEWENRSSATCNRYLGYLRAVFIFGVRQGLITRNPMAQWRKAKERGKHEVRLTVEDLQRLIAHAEPHIAWALEVAWMCGARPGPTELFRLRHDDHDPNSLTLHVRGTKTAQSDRLVPITQAESLRLIEMEPFSKSGFVIEYEGQPVNQMYKGLKTAIRRAGLNYEVRWYDVRHLWASEMLRQGADLAAVSALLGHADITTTQRRYYHLLQGEKKRAVGLRPVIRKEKPGKVVKIR